LIETAAGEVHHRWPFRRTVDERHLTTLCAVRRDPRRRVPRLAEEGGTEVMSTDERTTGLRRFFARLTASEAELDAQELQRDSAKCGAMPAGQCRRGQVVSVSGRLRTVAYTPRTNLPTLEADLYDGSDVVTLVFLGRRSIVGIEPGRQLTARGRIALRDDRKVIYNPYYELEAPR
jgi:hypothetical protein